MGFSRGKKTPYEDHTTKKKNMPLMYLMHFQFVTYSEEATDTEGKRQAVCWIPYRKTFACSATDMIFFCKAALANMVIKYDYCWLPFWLVICFYGVIRSWKFLSFMSLIFSPYNTQVVSGSGNVTVQESTPLQNSPLCRYSSKRKLLE